MKRLAILTFFVLTFFVLTFFIFAHNALAFQYVDPDLFVKPTTRFGLLIQRIQDCRFRIACYSEKKLGAFTQLNSTDQLSNFPTTYNNNLAITIETGTTSVASITTLGNLTSAASLATIGTITSGVWNASTTNPKYGGTGSTTLSANQLLLGGGTGEVRVVNGFGSSGQLLTSNGAGAAPTWQSSSFDTTANYTLTGQWLFSTGSTTHIQNIYLTGSTTIRAASSTAPLRINDVDLSFSSQKPTYATGTVLTFNDNMHGQYMHPEFEFLEETISTGATTTIFATTTFPVRKELLIKIYIPGFSANTGAGLRFNGDGENNYGWSSQLDGAYHKDSNPLTKAGSVSGLDLIDVDPNATTTALVGEIWVTSNSAGVQKQVRWHLSGSGANPSDPPYTITGAGVWGNLGKTVTSLYLYTCNGNTANCPAGSGQTFNAGTRITIYGSRPQ